jgi:hypothetical protein
MFTLDFLLCDSVYLQQACRLDSEKGIGIIDCKKGEYDSNRLEDKRRCGNSYHNYLDIRVVRLTDLDIEFFDKLVKI